MSAARGAFACIQIMYSGLGVWKEDGAEEMVSQMASAILELSRNSEDLAVVSYEHM